MTMVVWMTASVIAYISGNNVTDLMLWTQVEYVFNVVNQTFAMQNNLQKLK